MSLYFNKKYECDNNIDYEIYDGDCNIGSLNITHHDEYLFIRHIRINENLRGLGYATLVMDYVLEYYQLPVRLCVNHNESAKGFWENYFKEKNVKRDRGSIYTIYVS